MKKLLNTLYVTTQGAYLSKDGETVSVSIEKEVRLRVPVHTLGGIVCFGNVLCSPFLMGFCAESGVGLSFLTEYGRFLARIQGKASGNVLLRREQYRKADNEHFCANIARSMLAGKIANCRTVLQRSVRDHNEKIDVEEIASVSRLMGNYISRLETCAGLDIIRGMEGDAARNYFSVFNQLITAQKDDFVFHERNRRPPLDNVNCLLSFIYTLLMHDVRSALECVGLDPAVGFLHSDRPGRAGLALDMMEEFRPFIADRLALSLINLRQVQAKGFIRTETGAVLMDDATRKPVLVAYQERKREEMLHPFIDEKIQIGLLFHVQAMLLARYLRGDLDGYPPFIWK